VRAVTRTISESEWRAEGAKRFGEDTSKWRFVCPVCRHVATPADWRAVKAPDNAIAFSCVGRWMPNAAEAFRKIHKGPCNYAGGGLFRLNPVVVESGDVRHEMFEFAEAVR
jgi:hypothetical protein